MNSPTFYVDAFQNDLYFQGLSEQVIEPWIWIVCYLFLRHHTLDYFCVIEEQIESVSNECWYIVMYDVWLLCIIYIQLL